MHMRALRALAHLLRDDAGVSMVEYGIIAAVLAIPLLVAGYALVQSCGSALTGTGTQLTAIGANPPP